MKNEAIFNQATLKLFELVNEKGKDTNCNPKTLCVQISKDDFNVQEWEFLVENEPNFYFENDVSGIIEKLPVYKIDNDKVFSNKICVLLIGNKYHK